MRAAQGRHERARKRKPVRASAGARREPERRGERLALRLDKSLGRPPERRDRADRRRPPAGSASRPRRSGRPARASPSRRRDRAPQRRLSDTGLAANQQRARASRSRRAEVAETRRVPRPARGARGSARSPRPNCRAFLMRFTSARPTVEATSKEAFHVESRPRPSHGRNERRHRRRGRCGRECAGPPRLRRRARSRPRSRPATCDREAEARVTKASANSVIESYLLLTSTSWSYESCRPTTASTTRSAPSVPCVPTPQALPDPLAPLPLAGRRSSSRFKRSSRPRRRSSGVAPDPGLLFFLVERDELQGFDMPALAKALAGNPARSPASSAATHSRRDHTPQAVHAARSRTHP